MKYGTFEFYVMKGSVSITHNTAKEIRHYPGTDLNEVIGNGREATIISCTIITTNETDRVQALQILHDEESEEILYYNNDYYKNVKCGQTSAAKPLDNNKTVWEIGAEFIATDPVPYDQDTDLARY